ncbi:adenylate/guanylate cyclase domain-containing protein [Pseudonocardia sp.]|uniref:adenylate/guanylate cyclase domain-containing protein n=1 Tax=Pseudonocardia sp. TaxID=60912 RepID=UPI003D0F241F
MPAEGRDRRVLERPVRISLAAVVVLINVVSAVVVLVLAGWVVPTGPLERPGAILAENVLLFGAYTLVAVPVGVAWGVRNFRLRRDEDPAVRRHIVLFGPLRLVVVQAALWTGAVLVFAGWNARHTVRLALVVGETVLLGGIGACAVTYLATERILRRSAARELAGRPLGRGWLPGITLRSLIFWTVGTATPLSGMLVACVAALVHGDVPVGQLAVVVLVVGAIALLGGLVITVASARAIADPVDDVRTAMQRVSDGDLDVRVPVYDGTELGQLQAGFNDMVAGLRERERLRDLFGRQVGRDVAAVAAAAEEVRLGGEVRRVAVLFVDLVGSTTLAARLPPTEVVALLNRFFAVVVEVVESCDGWINKFEGDAALAVFGAPVEHPDPAGRALAAARVLAGRIADELPEIDAGIGVSAGAAVAGYVGDPSRYEYTVIGDPVNEAARLTDVAKSLRGRVAAAAQAVELARESGGAAEADRWKPGRRTRLRGRADLTQIATPRPA